MRQKKPSQRVHSKETRQDKTRCKSGEVIEVHPIFAYASAEAFSEMLVPCPWYILPLVEEVGLRRKGWRPLDLEGFRAREGK